MFYWFYYVSNTGVKALNGRISSPAGFEVFTALKIQVEVVWVVTPCTNVSEVHAASIFRANFSLKLGTLYADSFVLMICVCCQF